MSDDQKVPRQSDMTPSVEPETHRFIAAAIDDATGQKLLAAIEEVRDEARERDKKTDARFERIESRLEEVRDETRQNTKNIGEQADAITRVARAAANAVELAYEAKKQAANASDETTKVVESALRIHGTSIAMTVDQAVKATLGPLAADVESLKKNDAEQSATLSDQNKTLAELKTSDEKTESTLKEQGEKISGIDEKVAGVGTKVDGVVTSIGTIASGVAKLARWQDAWWVKVALALAVIAGGFYAGLRAAKPTAVQTTIVTPQAPAQLPPSTSPNH